MKKESQEKINQLSMIEQSLHSIISQKQNFQAQVMEIESAEEELKGAKTSYQIVGNVMVEKNPEELRKELKNEKEELKKQMKGYEEREEKIREQAGKLQEELLKEMESDEE